MPIASIYLQKLCYSHSHTNAGRAVHLFIFSISGEGLLFPQKTPNVTVRTKKAFG